LKVDYVEEGSSVRHLDIEVPAEDLSQQFEKGVDRLRRTVKLPGFRKGKIPKDVIRQRFRSDVMNEAVQDLVPQALNEALTQRELYPLSDPRISQLESELGKPLKFRASFEVLPDIEVVEYKGIEAQEPKAEVTDEQIQKGIEALREQHARFDPIEGRGARDNDFVMGHLTETPAGGIGGGGPQKHEGVSIEVGSESYHPMLHEKLQGANPGDTLDFVATFAEDHPNPERRGRAFDVSFELVELKQKVLSEADDELAKDLGEFDTLSELEAHLRERALEEARQRAEQELRNQLLKKLIEKNPFDAPESLVEMEMDGRIESIARDLAERGIDPNRAGIDWRGLRREQRAGAEDAVKSTILLDQIAAQESLKPSDEELDEEIAAVAKAFEKSPEAMRALMVKDGTLERVRGRLRREKAVDFVKQHAKLE
jgi:trigger factor